MTEENTQGSKRLLLQATDKVNEPKMCEEYERDNEDRREQSSDDGLPFQMRGNPDRRHKHSGHGHDLSSDIIEFACDALDSVNSDDNGDSTCRQPEHDNQESVAELERHDQTTFGVSQHSLTAAADSINRADILVATASWLGTPYVHQASAKGAGCDCLGLIRGVWRDVYGAEPEPPPPYTPDWNERKKDEPLLSAARRNLIEKQSGEIEPGDVIIFRIVADGPAKHCGIATSPNAFIHAYAGRAVVESWMNRWWRQRIAGVFSFPGVE